ncbi:hypothetical protein [Alkalicoccus halolimnae]|uniref:Uncharacterized protein n=1 Tax=Alkalicoccus halolimnae TaxID=1667239 RepID=A0AAJ8N270_9BACI|nr:hypothetical protein [Alkalicoccus halolimnae]
MNKGKETTLSSPHSNPPKRYRNAGTKKDIAEMKDNLLSKAK